MRMSEDSWTLCSLRNWRAISSISACAWANVTPGFKRPNTVNSVKFRAGAWRVVETQRLPDVRVGHEKRLGREEKAERLRHDANDLVVHAIEHDAPSDDRTIAAVAALPQVVGQDRDLRVAGLFFRAEMPSEHRIDAEERKKVRGDWRDVDAFGLVAVDCR